MEDPHYQYFIKELKSQVDTRIEMAVDRKYEYEGEDPINSLPLTEYQKGLVVGRLETWEFFSRLIPDVVKLVLERYGNEDRQKANISSTDPGPTD